MKTFPEIFTQMFNEIYKSPEGWPDNLSISKVHAEAAKEYAKGWVEEAAMIASTCAANGVDVVNTVMELRNEIDAQ